MVRKTKHRQRNKKKVKILPIILFVSMIIMAACSLPDRANNNVIIYTKGLGAGDALGIEILDQYIEERQKQETVSPEIKYEKLDKHEKSDKNDNILYIGILSILMYLFFKEEKRIHENT